ncbi:hypothetical protein [uncultured Cohaesibacter sp.]|uniref:hypothetical protein n=1 Tax=uncultured Cohaesibacter sp. TaxID=1002546 RepID=UPI002AA7E509|nr:hypothetical protein [uncultured Cohaesibacter sp.]
MAGRALGTGMLSGSVWALAKGMMDKRQKPVVAAVMMDLIISFENVRNYGLFEIKTLLLPNYGEEIP